MENNWSPDSWKNFNLKHLPIYHSNKKLKQVVDQLKNQLDLIIDGGELLENQPSTIVSCSRKKFKILRHGAITMAELKRICEVE